MNPLPPSIDNGLPGRSMRSPVVTLTRVAVIMGDRRSLFGLARCVEVLDVLDCQLRLRWQGGGPRLYGPDVVG
jgi:hypothetical protein